MHKSTIIYPLENRIDKDYPFNLIDGYDTLRIETYSVSLAFVRAFSTPGGPGQLDIIYGKPEMLLTPEVKLTAGVMPKHEDARILQWLQNIEARERELYAALTANRFRLWTSHAPSHKKMFLLERASGERRALVGSANASIPSLSGKIEECVVVFDEGPICDALFQEFETKKANSDAVELGAALAWLDAGKT